ncbi:MAG: hypothetical protein IKZ82_12165 [Clostridia bacterium]|nr:hypothetical protein [Clostridia bacterium]
MQIYITSEIPSAVSIHAERFFRAGTDTTVFRFGTDEFFESTSNGSESASALLLLSPAGSSCKPICAALTILRRSGELFLDAKIEGDYLRVIDWSGEGSENSAVEPILELIPEYPESERILEPCELDMLQVERSSKDRTELNLYRDCGLRLSVRENGGERGYFLGSGETGSLRLLDVGFERVLIVHASGCGGSSQFKNRESASEKLIIFNESFELIGEIRGGRCFIENGYLVAINELDTVHLHQQRLKYELTIEGLRPFCDDADADEGAGIGELGFFTHPARRPESEEETALALMECVLLERKDEAMALLSPALSEGLDFYGLCEFFGDFDEARPAPFAKKSDPPTVGAVVEGRAKAYVFEFEGGLINDISELEPPYSRRAQESVTEEAE